MNHFNHKTPEEKKEDRLIKASITAWALVFATSISLIWGIRWAATTMGFNLKEVGMVYWGAYAFLSTLLVALMLVLLKQAIEKRSALEGAVRNFNVDRAYLQSEAEGTEIKNENVDQKRPKSKAVFMANVDREISDIMDYLMKVLGGLMITMHFLIHFESGWLGLVTIFLVSFIISLFREVAFAYDNPLEGNWQMKRVPPHWREEALESKRTHC